MWLGFCTWACAHFTNNVAYAFQLAGYTAAIIAFPMVNVHRDYAVVGYRSGARMRGHCRYPVRRHDDDDTAQHLRWHHAYYRAENHAFAFTGARQLTLATGYNDDDSSQRTKR
ncbi:MAG: hypothetical protein ACFWT4_19985 [Citrobacter braakii]